MHCLRTVDLEGPKVAVRLSTSCVSIQIQRFCYKTKLLDIFTQNIQQNCDSSVCTTEKVDVAADSLQLVDEYYKETVGCKHRRINSALIIHDDVTAGIDVNLTVAAEQITDTQLHAHSHHHLNATSYTVGRNLSGQQNY